jgi:type II secretory pathway component PulM
MAFATLSMRDRRALQRGALIIGAAVLYAVGVRPSRERRAQLLEQLDVERAVLVRERVVANGRPASPAAASNDSALRLFRGADAVIASAALVEYLASEAERHEVWVQQAVTASPATAERMDLEVTVRAESDIGGLLRWLGALERGPMLTRVHALDVRATTDGGDGGTSPLAISAVIRSLAEPQGVTR